MDDKLQPTKKIVITMPKIATNLWYDTQAKEAAEFYVSTFAAIGDENSKIIDISTIHDTPSGMVEIVTINVLDHEFTLISAGPLFKFNPSISFLIACKTKAEVDMIWGKFSAGGKVLMELGEYPFSKWYGWTQDKYGLSWQIMLFGDGQKITQRITPTLMFVGDVCGKAEEAAKFYVSVFHSAQIGDVIRYGPGEEPDKEGTVKHLAFTVEGQEFGAMDSAHKHNFSFNEAISFMIYCQNQEEIDYYWEKLSAVPEAEQCGWLKDKYGVSWQVVPVRMTEMLKDKDPEKIARVTQAFLKMKKYDLATLERAYTGKE